MNRGVSGDSQDSRGRSPGLRRPAPVSARKCRIAVCIRRFEYGGQGSVVEEELKHLQDEFTVALLAEDIKRAVPSGINAIETKTWSRFPLANERLLQILGQFDVIHCHDSLGFMNAARSSGQPFVVTAHGIAPLALRSSIRGMLEGAVTLIYYKKLYRSAAVVVAISDYIAKWLASYAGIDSRVIRHGSGPPVERVSRPEKKGVLYVGEVSRRKGIPDLIAGIEAAPSDVTLDVIGHGDIRTFIRRARREGVGERVRFHGVVGRQQLEAAYQQAWCTVSASRWEGFGLPVLEGFRFGRPAIVRRQGGLEELVRLSEAGFCFIRPEELGEAIHAVGHNWDALSHRALQYANAHSWKDAFDSYSRLFHRVLSSR